MVKCPCWHDLCYQSGDDESGWHACSFELGRKAFDLDSHLIFPGGHIYFDSKEELMPIWMLMIRIAMDQKLSLSAKSILVKVTSMPCRTIAIKGCPTVIISASKAKVFVYVGSSWYVVIVSLQENEEHLDRV